MKITVNVDCTPEEARSFLGLPDLKPLHDAFVQDMQQRMSTGMQALSPEEMMKNWMLGQKGLEQMQALFAQMTGLTRE